jgi:hypothetical protein
MKIDTAGDSHYGAVDMATMSWTFTPFMLQGGTPEMLQMHFDGLLPEIGDALELVCYERTETSVSMKWRVRKP